MQFGAGNISIRLPASFVMRLPKKYMTNLKKSEISFIPMCLLLNSQQSQSINQSINFLTSNYSVAILQKPMLLNMKYREPLNSALCCCCHAIALSTKSILIQQEFCNSWKREFWMSSSLDNPTYRLAQVAGNHPKLTCPRILSSKCASWDFCYIRD